jgi:formylmethanofuran dehydrogenase subunit E
MEIGPYSFEEYLEKAAAFHGNPAPGLILGGYMVELAKSRLPEGCIFDAIVETPKCLPDAVQLLTLCSYGNGWMKIVNLGRYAVSLYDKFTGKGVRVFLDSEKLKSWPEIES